MKRNEYNGNIDGLMNGVNVAEEGIKEENYYANELTPNGLEMYRRVKAYEKGKATKKYNAEMKRNLENVLQSEYRTLNGTMFTVGEKLAQGMVLGLMKKANEGKLSIEDYVNLLKATGEYAEKQEVQVSGLESILDKLESDEEY